MSTRYETTVSLCAAICRSNNAVLCGAGSLAGNRQWSKAINPEQSNVEGVKAHDDFTSNTLGNDVILDTRHGVAGISALARLNWCR